MCNKNQEEKRITPCYNQKRPSAQGVSAANRRPRDQVMDRSSLQHPCKEILEQLFSLFRSPAPHPTSEKNSAECSGVGEREENPEGLLFNREHQVTEQHTENDLIPVGMIFNLLGIKAPQKD